MITPEALKEGLAQFSGSEHRYKNPMFQGLEYTEGVKWLLDQAECHWLFAEVWAGYKTCKAVRDDPLTFWTLKVESDQSAELTVIHDTGCAPLYYKAIPWTDFPPPGVKLYLDNGVLLLPGEY